MSPAGLLNFNWKKKTRQSEFLVESVEMEYGYWEMGQPLNCRRLIAKCRSSAMLLWRCPYMGMKSVYTGTPSLTPNKP